MEKAPGAAPEAPEEKPKTPEPPKLTKEDAAGQENLERSEAFFENSGYTDVAEAVREERAQQKELAEKRGIEAEIEEHKHALEELERDAQAHRLTERYKEAGYNRAKAHELAEQESGVRRTRIRELEEMKAAREAKPDVIGLTEDMVVKETDPRRTKTLEDDPTVDVDALNKRYEKSLDDGPHTPEQREKKKEHLQEQLADARPKVREKVMKWLAEKAVMSLVDVGLGKILQTAEMLAKNPDLKRQQAEQKVGEFKKALEEAQKKQLSYRNNPTMLWTLQQEEERLRGALNVAKLEATKVENNGILFNTGKRALEGFMLTCGSAAVRQIDGLLDPYKRQEEQVRGMVERTGKVASLIDRRMSAYEEKLLKMETALRTIENPLEQKALKDQIKALRVRKREKALLLGRVVNQRRGALQELRKNEKVTASLRARKNRFARAVGLETLSDVEYKGTPPEDLPIAPKGQEGSNKVVDLAERAKEKGFLGRMFERKPEKVDQAGIDKFVRKWNGGLNRRLNMRIKDPEMFKSMFGDDQVISPSRMQHVLTKYFEAEAERRGKPLTGSERKQIKRGAGEALGKVFYMEGRTKKTAKRVGGTAAKVAKKIIPSRKQ